MGEPISDERLEANRFLARVADTLMVRLEAQELSAIIARLEAAEAKLTEYRKYADRLENEEHQRIQAEERVAELKAELEAAEKQAEAARWSRGTWREQAEVAKQRIAELEAENQQLREGAKILDNSCGIHLARIKRLRRLAHQATRGERCPCCDAAIGLHGDKAAVHLDDCAYQKCRDEGDLEE